MASHNIVIGTKVPQKRKKKKEKEKKRTIILLSQILWGKVNLKGKSAIEQVLFLWETKVICAYYVLDLMHEFSHFRTTMNQDGGYL